MTTTEIAEYYADLLILQYLEKTKAYETVKALVTPIIMDQLPVDVQDGFNLLGSDLAEGAQLDTLGKYVGVTRYGYDFDGEPLELDDDDFRSLITFAILNNNSTNTLSEIQALIADYFPGQLLIFDYQNMRLSYFIDSDVGSQDFLQFVVTADLLPKPMGVQIAAIIYAPIIDTFYGFRTYDLPPGNVSPFNTYDDYDMDYPWLSYVDAVEYD